MIANYQALSQNRVNAALEGLFAAPAPELNRLYAAMRYSVMSIPTLLLFDGGDVKKKIVGAKGKGALMQELDEFLATSH